MAASWGCTPEKMIEADAANTAAANTIPPVSPAHVRVADVVIE